MQEAISYSRTETAKEIRAALKEAFPGVKFSVRIKGRSVNVNWVDGPSWAKVNELTRQFEGATFDGMNDLKSIKPPVAYKGKLVRWGADYVIPQRTLTEGTLRRAAMIVCARYNHPIPEIVPAVEGKGFRVSAWIKGGDEPICQGAHHRNNVREAIYQQASEMSF